MPFLSTDNAVWKKNPRPAQKFPHETLVDYLARDLPAESCIGNGFALICPRTISPNLTGKITALDANGNAVTDLGVSSEIKIQPGTLY